MAESFTLVLAWSCLTGASLVQVYTGFAYEGPAMLPRLKRELAVLLARDGFKHLEDAVGADHRK